MRELDVSTVVEPVAQACIQANRELPAEMVAALRQALECESSELGRWVLRTLLENAQLARDKQLPMCQDTGAVVVFAEVGQDLHLVGGDLYEAIDRGVSDGYRRGYLRKSIVADPLAHEPNTGDNTPAIVHVRLVPGEGLKLHVMAKGGGSENMSALWMLTPAAGAEGVVDAVVERIRQARGRPCPPLVLGIGIGGTFEKAALLAKEALLRPLGQPHPDEQVAQLEAAILRAVNATGIGPLGLGGDTTALAVHVLTHPCHIASLPVALNVQCHAARHVTIEL